MKKRGPNTAHTLSVQILSWSECHVEYLGLEARPSTEHSIVTLRFYFNYLNYTNINHINITHIRDMLSI